MANNYFEFKQFKVYQQNCAMKVCTDACLFGAWVADKFSDSKVGVDRVLDIGTGTGLLSLMLAQKNMASFNAVEIDEAAAQQARENFEASPFKQRLKAYHTTVQNFKPTKNYDLIICNPPFFQNDLKSVDAKRNLALHDDTLSLQELIDSVSRLLTETGSFAVLFSTIQGEKFRQLANQNLFYLQEEVLVKQTDKHPYFRMMLLYSRLKYTSTKTEITIKKNNEYSAEFVELLKDYYLYL